MARMTGGDLKQALNRVGLSQRAAARVLTHYSDGVVSQATIWRWCDNGGNKSARSVPAPVAALVAALEIMTLEQRQLLPGWVSPAGRQLEPRAPRTVRAERPIANCNAQRCDDDALDEPASTPLRAQPEIIEHLACQIQDDEHPRDLAYKLARACIADGLLDCDLARVKGHSFDTSGRIVMTRSNSLTDEEGWWQPIKHSPAGYADAAQWAMIDLIRRELRNARSAAQIANVQDQIAELKGWKPDEQYLADLAKAIRDAEDEAAPD